MNILINGDMCIVVYVHIFLIAGHSRHDVCHQLSLTRVNSQTHSCATVISCMSGIDDSVTQFQSPILAVQRFYVPYMYHKY